MSTRTDAPHWSLWLLDELLPELALPADPAGAIDAWQGAWTLYEVIDPATRLTLEGFLELSLTTGRLGVEMDVTQSIPMSYGIQSLSTSAVRCRDNTLLTPRSWKTSFELNPAATESLPGTAEGWVSRSVLNIKSIDRSERTLPPKTPLTSNWSLMAAFPRIHASGRERLRFTLLEDLCVIRPRQVLDRIEEIEVECANGTHTLTGYRLHGEGTPPLFFWVSEKGLPVLGGGLVKGFAATEFLALDTEVE